MHKNRISRANKGFTLVELIISVAVLAIIAVPIASVFMSSSRITSDTVQLGGANLTARNVLEQLDTADFSDWFERKTVPQIIDSGTAGAVNGYFVQPNESTTILDYHAITAPGDTPPYYIAFDNVSFGYSAYNVVVTFSTGAEGSDLAVLNDTLINQNTAIEYASAQTRMPSQDPDNLSWEEFLQSAANLGYDISNEQAFYSRVAMSREIVMDISQQNDKVFATVTYKYVYTYPTKYTTESVDGAIMGTNFVFDSPEISLTPQGGASVPQASQEYPTLHLLYFPWYKGTDNITVNNLQDLPITVALAKQVDAQYTVADLTVKEANYAARVEVIETDKSSMTTKIISNIGNNLTNGAQSANVQHIFNGTAFLPTGLVEMGAQDRVFDVTVELFRIDENGNSIYGDKAELAMYATLTQ